jgi:hypothetical protein
MSVRYEPEEDREVIEILTTLGRRVFVSTIFFLAFALFSNSLMKSLAIAFGVFVLQICSLGGRRLAQASVLLFVLTVIEWSGTFPIKSLLSAANNQAQRLH